MSSRAVYIALAVLLSVAAALLFVYAVAYTYNTIKMVKERRSADQVGESMSCIRRYD